MATYQAGNNGRIIATSLPLSTSGFTQSMTGSPIDAAAAKTMSNQAAQAEAMKALGAGQKGASRRRRRRGGSTAIPKIPEAGTIPGVSHATNHVNAINNLNQLRASAVYDGLVNAPPVQLGGKKRSRKSKKNGRRRNRTHRRNSHKRTSHLRKSRHVL